MLANKKILVTGADGFIGSHLVESLVEKKADVKTLVMYNSFNSWGWLDSIDNEIKREIEVCPGDIRDQSFVEDAVNGCDVVINLAALIAIPYSYRSPRSYVDVNIGGLLNILQASQKNDIQKIIHTSTSEVYGTAEYVPICENHPLQPQSPYSATKIGADQLAMSFYNSFDLPVSIVRPFNTYGPRQSARAVIPAAIIQILNNKREIRLGNLHPTRDFNYVSDTVDGFIASVESDKNIGEIVNIGSGFEITIGDTVRLISEIMGRDIEVTQDKERIRVEKSEVDRLFASNEKALSLLNWRPSYSGIEGFQRGLEETIKWFSSLENIESLYKMNMYNV